MVAFHRYRHHRLIQPVLSRVGIQQRSRNTHPRALRAWNKSIELGDYLLRLFQLYEMTSAFDYDPGRLSDADVNGAAIGMDICDVGFACKNQGGRFDFRKPLGGWW